MLGENVPSDTLREVIKPNGDRRTEGIADGRVVLPVADDRRSATSPIAFRRWNLDNEVPPVLGELNASLVEDSGAGLDHAGDERNGLLPAKRVVRRQLLAPHVDVIRRGVVERLRPEDEHLRHAVTCMKI